MILKGASRSNGNFFAKHLMNVEGNERVSVVEMRGFTAETVPAAFQELAIVGVGTGVKNTFYHLSINPDPTEPELTPDQWQRAVEISAEQLGLSDQPRFVIQHEKNGRTHEHIIFSRIAADTMTAISDSHNYQAHDRARVQLEQEFDHKRTPDTPEPSQRKSRQFAEWEHFKASQGRSVDPAEMKAELTALWQQSDSGRAFQAAVEEQGYLLAKGDRRDFVVIDPEGSIHSLGRRIDGAKAADIRAKMSDLDPASLMTAQEASAWMKGKEEAENSGSSDLRSLPEEQAEKLLSYEEERAKYIAETEAMIAATNAKYPEMARALPESYPITYVAQEATAQHEKAMRHKWKHTSVEQLAIEAEREHDAWEAEQERLAAMPDNPQQSVDTVHQATRADGRSLTAASDPPPQSWQEMIDKYQQSQYEKKDEPELER